MSEFTKVVITKKGQALMAKLMSGAGTVEFTEIRVSDTTYSESALENLTSLSGVKQTTPVSKVVRTNNVAVQVEAAITNANLNTGYYIRTLGLYAKDPQEGVILYAVTTATTAGYFPPFNGKTTSAAVFKFITTIGNADNVTIQVDPGGVATIGDVRELESKVADLQAYVGYTDESIVGIEVDFEARTVKRIAGAVNRTPGASFDDINAFGGRVRVNLTDDGVEVARFGDGSYTENGALTQAVTINDVTYPIGEAVQVMVKQPKYYYKVVPLKTEKIEGEQGYHLRKVRYYISDEAKAGFKLHPAFKDGELVNNYIYVSAYEGSYYDVSAETYNKIDSQDVGFTNDMLSSIAGAKPASGLTQSLTRTNARLSAQNRGTGWNLQNIVTLSMSQLLFVIEYASFNSQNVIGHGVAYSDDGESNMADNTGDTSALGNKSGVGPNGSVSYRGEENLWMNIWKWIDGYNLRGWNEHKIYVAPMNGEFADGTADNYDLVGFTQAKTSGYISAFGYDEEHDYLFIPTETVGNSSVPVGDNHWQNASAGAWLAVLSGGGWYSGANGGLFSLGATSSAASRGRGRGARSVYAAQN